MMRMKAATIIRSAAAIATAGAVAYMLSNTSPRTMRKLKKNAGKALQSFGNVFNAISSMM